MVSEATTPLTANGSGGVNVIDVVDLWGTYAHISHETRRLLDMSIKWPKDDVGQAVDPEDRDTPQRHYQPRQPESLAVRIGEDGVRTLTKRFLAGTSKQQLADYYGCSLSTVERLLRTRGVRRWARTAVSRSTTQAERVSTARG